MMRIYLIALALLFGAAHAHAADCVRDSNGNVVCGRGQCATDQYGKVYCAREGGGAIRDQYGTVRCGIGFCATDDGGRVMCSRTAGGGARMDAYGKVKCLAGCEEASARMCEEPR
jgi:hypothetical protein